MIERAEGVPVLRAGGSAIDSDSDRLRLVYAVQRILAAADDETALIRGAAALLAEYRSYKLIALYVAEPDGSLAPIAGDGSLRYDAERWKIRARWDDSPLGRGTMGSAIRSGVPVVRTPEDWVDPDWRAAALPHGVRKSAAFPFTLGESMAVLYALTDDPQGFAPPELELLQSLAEDIGRSLDNLRMRSALVAERARAERRLARLEALWELANEPNEIDAQAQAIVSEGAQRLEMEWGAIGHVEGKAICVDFVTADDPVKLAGKRIAVDDSVTGSAVAERRTVAHGNILDDPQLSHFQTARDYGTRAVIATPFTSGDREHVLFFGARSLREQPFDEEDFSYIELLAAFFSKTLQQRDDEARIVFLQQHDPLTLLPTRPRMQARLDELLARAGGGLALLLIDVNAFGKINAEHGYETGDQMLVEIAHRLILELEPAYELYRISGDAFGVVVPLNDVKVNDTLARRLVTVLAEPMRHHGRDIPMSVCIGMAVAPEDGRSSTELEINAEAALRRAKTEGDSGPRYYSTAVDHALTHRRVLESELRAALAARELVLFYQPVVDLRSEAVVGLEALVRWPHATRGLIPPADFIPIAEESDAIIALGIAVMELAAAQTPHFLSGGKRIPVAINLSAAQFQDPRLLDDLKSMVATCGPGCFEIELTESVAMHDSSAVLATLSACKDLGLRVALDDFGTGHSSLTLLRRLPIDIVKIDRSFISGIPDDIEDAAIARAVVALARSLGCEVRAEGVETPTQAAWLRAEGCDSAQGYLYAKPLPWHELAAWMESRHTASK